MQFKAALLVLILMSPLFAADETDALRIMCNSLLNQKTEAPNITNIPSIENQTINFTFSKQYFAAKTQLETANQSIQKLIDAGYPYLRAQDSYLVAYQWLVGQAALEEQGQDYDYRFITEKADEIKQIERSSFTVGDDLRALAGRLSNISRDANLSEPLSLMADAKKEFEDNRFEEAQRLATMSYDKAAKAEADAQRSKTLLESTRKNIEGFLAENWAKIAGAIAVLCIVFFIFQKQIRRFLLKSKMSAILAERAVLESMMKKMQTDYFDNGTLNEMSFHIKTKKFADMIRDINRQIPLIKEELKKI